MHLQSTMTNASYISSLAATRDKRLPASNKQQQTSETSNSNFKHTIHNIKSSNNNIKTTNDDVDNEEIDFEENRMTLKDHDCQQDQLRIKRPFKTMLPSSLQGSATSESAKKRWSLLAEAVRHGLTKQNQERRFVKRATTSGISLEDDASCCLLSSAGLCVWTKLDRIGGQNHFISSTFTDCVGSSLQTPKQIAKEPIEAKEKLSASSSLDTTSSEYDENSDKYIYGSTNSIRSDIDEIYKHTNQEIEESSQNLNSDSSSSSSDETLIWMECRCPKIPSLSLRICHRIKQLSFNDLVETFDNTGNVRIWPSEEILAYYALNNKHLFEGKTICELGAGMAGLASLAVVSTTKTNHVYITDGNERCVENISYCIAENMKNSQARGDISARQLRWSNLSDYEDIRSKIDVIICSDCLYLDKSRTHLVRTMSHLLKNDGKAIVIAPNRGSSLDHFMDIAKLSGFVVMKIFNYIDELYDTYKQLLNLNMGDPIKVENIVNQYPILIRLKKQEKVNSQLHNLSSADHL